MKKGDAVDVVILNIDSENKRISLGLKQAEEDPWLKIGETYPVGTELPATVVRLMDKGVVVDLGNDIEGFVPVSQLNPEGTVTNPADFAWETMKLNTRVLEVDPIHRRIVMARGGRAGGSAAQAGHAKQGAQFRRRTRAVSWALLLQTPPGSHDSGGVFISPNSMHIIFSIFSGCRHWIRGYFLAIEVLLDEIMPANDRDGRRCVGVILFCSNRAQR